MSNYVEAIYSDPRRMNFLRRVARYAGVPEPFIDDAVQDIIVSTWIHCPDGKGWYLQARWVAHTAAERYGTIQRKRNDRKALEQVRITTMEVLEQIPQDQWWIVEKVLDFRAAVQELSPKETSAVELAAQARLTLKKGKKSHNVPGDPNPPRAMTANEKKYLGKARAKLRTLIS